MYCLILLLKFLINKRKDNYVFVRIIKYYLYFSFVSLSFIIIIINFTLIGILFFHIHYISNLFFYSYSHYYFALHTYLHFIIFYRKYNVYLSHYTHFYVFLFIDIKEKFLRKILRIL